MPEQRSRPAVRPRLPLYAWPQRYRPEETPTLLIDADPSLSLVLWTSR